MRSYLSSLGVAGVVAACLVSGSALANSTGITGRSGKQGANTTCTGSSCHSGGTGTPTVTLEGPATLEPNQVGNYKLIVRGGPGARAGFNVAVDNGSLNAGGGSQKLSGELTHIQPRAFTNGEAVFDFTLVAPASNGTVKLFGAGNSANNNGAESGDSSALAQLTINVGTGGGNGGGGDDDEDKGCAAAGGAPLLGAALLLLGARLRRRRA
ncbi:MAG TPA: MXAN_6652 family MXYO-CTERM-anchored protein [Myxococcus sp.]|nr:MXAN_6652 family MXYO-CTERM-anchored protein [Myxococcus sp.]